MAEADQNQDSRQDRQTRLVRFDDFPGLGGRPHYIDESMVPKLETFLAYARARGVEPDFNWAYRTQEQQDALHGNPSATTPARQSLHSTGFAFDVNFDSIPRADRQILLEAAEAAGLKWGGTFSDPDRPHFYSDLPEGVTRGQAIQDAREDYDNLTNARTRLRASNGVVGENGLNAALAGMSITGVLQGDAGQESRQKLSDQLQTLALEQRFQIGPGTRIETSESGNSLRLVNGDGINVTVRDVAQTLAADQSAIAANLESTRQAAAQTPESISNPVQR